MVNPRQVSIRLFSIASRLALLLTLLSTAVTRAADVAISDGASVLNINAIKREASSLSHSIYIFTTPSFTTSADTTPPDWLKDPTAIAHYQEQMHKDALPSDFDSHTKGALSEHSTDIAIGIDVKDRYVSIQSNQGVPLSNDAARKAVDDFKTNFVNNDYTEALIVALYDIRTTLNEHALDGLWKALGWVGAVLVIVLLFVLNVVFKGNSSRRGYYHHSSSYHSDSSSSSSSDSGGSGGGAGGFF